MPKGYTPALKLFYDFEAVFLDHRIRENLFGDALEFSLRLITVPAIQIQDEEFSLANIFHLCIAQSRQGVVNSLPLRIQHCALRHYPNMCFHANSIAFSLRGSRWPPVQSGKSGSTTSTRLEDAFYLPATGGWRAIFIMNLVKAAAGFSPAAGNEAICSVPLLTEMSAQSSASQV